VKYIDKMLIASGVTLLLTGGVAAAALAPGTADAVITQLPGGVAIFASNGPFGSPNTLATAATYIGITEAALRTELQTGKTLAQIAVEHGKTRDGLIAALSAEATKQITTAVDQPGTNFSGPGGRGTRARHRRRRHHAAAGRRRDLRIQQPVRIAEHPRDRREVHRHHRG
jgi:hypothetical protein